MTDSESDCLLSSESSSSDEGCDNYLTPDSEVDEPEVKEILSEVTESAIEKSTQQVEELVQEPSLDEEKSSNPSSKDNSDVEQAAAEEDEHESIGISKSDDDDQQSDAKEGTDDGWELDFTDCPAEVVASAASSDPEKDDIFETLEPETHETSEKHQAEIQSQDVPLEQNLGVQKIARDSSSSLLDGDSLDGGSDKDQKVLQHLDMSSVHTATRTEHTEDKRKYSEESNDAETELMVANPVEAEHDKIDDNLSDLAKELQADKTLEQEEMKPQPARRQQNQVRKQNDGKRETNSKPEVPKRPPSMSSTKRSDPESGTSFDNKPHKSDFSDTSDGKDVEIPVTEKTSVEATAPSIAKRLDIFEQQHTKAVTNTRPKPKVSARPPSLKPEKKKSQIISSSSEETLSSDSDENMSETGGNNSLPSIANRLNIFERSCAKFKAPLSSRPKKKTRSTSSEQTLSSESDESEKEFNSSKPLPSISKRLDAFERKSTRNKTQPLAKPKPAPKARPNLPEKSAKASKIGRKIISKDFTQAKSDPPIAEEMKIENENLSSVFKTRDVFEHSDNDMQRKQIKKAPAAASSSKKQVLGKSPKKIAAKQTKTKQDHSEEFAYLHGTEAPKILIISNKWFENLGFTDRHNHDSLKLEEMWQEFGCVTFARKNLSRNEMRLAVDEFAGKIIKGNEKYCAVFIDSLGRGDDEVIGVDGESISVDSILSEFKNTKQYLQNMPKFFILQCCKGVDEIPASGANEYQGLRLKPITNLTDSVVFFSKPRTQSYENERYGSCLIKELVDVFEKYSETKDLVEMLTIVNSRISNQAGAPKSDTEYSMGEIRSTFRKKLFIKA